MFRDHYVDVLAIELAVLADHLGRGFPLVEIALGGGSPNFLSGRMLRTLLQAIRTYFTVETGARLSVELDPRDTTAGQLDAFAAASAAR